MKLTGPASRLFETQRHCSRPGNLSWSFGRPERGHRMKIAQFLPALAFLAVGSAPALATDLTKIDRTIVKEPAYEGRPKYCLLVFGPEAKTRVWLVKDDNTLFIDRNGKGDWRAGDIPGPDGKSRYTVALRKYPKGVKLSVFQDG